MSQTAANYHLETMTRDLSEYSQWAISVSQQAQNWAQRLQQGSFINALPMGKSDVCQHPGNQATMIPPTTPLIAAGTGNQQMTPTESASIHYRTGRAVFSPWQIDILENQYNQGHYITPEVRAKLAHMSRLTELTVQNWFQNKRSKEARASNRKQRAGMLAPYRPHDTKSQPNNSVANTGHMVYNEADHNGRALINTETTANGQGEVMN